MRFCRLKTNTGLTHVRVFCAFILYFSLCQNR